MLSATLSKHHLSGFEIAQLEFHHQASNLCAPPDLPWSCLRELSFRVLLPNRERSTNYCVISDLEKELRLVECHIPRLPHPLLHSASGSIATLSSRQLELEALMFSQR